MGLTPEAQAIVDLWKAEAVKRSASWAIYMATKSVGLQAAYEAFQLGATHEREECAKIADAREEEEAKYSATCLQAAGGESAAWGIANAIRARGEE